MGILGLVLVSGGWVSLYLAVKNKKPTDAWAALRDHGVEGLAEFLHGGPGAAAGTPGSAGSSGLAPGAGSSGAGGSGGGGGSW